LLSEEEIDGLPRRSAPALFPAALVAIAFLSGILLIVVSRSCRTAADGPAAAPSSPPPAKAAPAPESPPASLAAVSTEPPAVASAAPADGKSVRKSVRPVPGQQPTPRPKPPRIGGNDIIDPWAGR
jgi:hypothetical protein